MQPFPHRYDVVATATSDGDVSLESEQLPTLRSAPPAEFGGPGDRWSPETLLVAAVADCFMLTFRAIAGASRLPWKSLTCMVEGTVERVDHVTQFTGFEMRAHLQVPPDANEEQARRLLARAEESCLVTNSLKATPHLIATVDVVAPVELATQ